LPSLVQQAGPETTSQAGHALALHEPPLPIAKSGTQSLPFFAYPEKQSNPHSALRQVTNPFGGACSAQGSQLVVPQPTLGEGGTQIPPQNFWSNTVQP
jgi:hypothetical protein